LKKVVEEIIKSKSSNQTYRNFKSRQEKLHFADFASSPEIVIFSLSSQINFEGRIILLLLREMGMFITLIFTAIFENILLNIIVCSKRASEIALLMTISPIEQILRKRVVTSKSGQNLPILSEHHSITFSLITNFVQKRPFQS